MSHRVTLACGACGHEWRGVPKSDRAGTGNPICPNCHTRSDTYQADEEPEEPQESPDESPDNAPGRFEWSWGDETGESDDMTDCDHDNTQPIPPGTEFQTSDGREAIAEPGDDYCPDCDAVITADGEVLE